VAKKPATTRRRLHPSAIALVITIAVSAVIGIVLSRGQRTAAVPPVPTAETVPVRIAPTPIPGLPVPGAGFAVADDPATNDILLFGGVNDDRDTWLWNGAKWTLAHPANSPPGRFDASAAYDPQTRTVFLFGGLDTVATGIHDTWAWNGSDWSALDSGAGGPQVGQGSDMAWDTATNQMLLVTSSVGTGSTSATWVWAATHWQRASDLPASALYTPMWFDPVTQALIGVACCDGPPSATGAVNSTWRWNGQEWSILSTLGDAPIDGSSLADDPTTGALTLCTCGSSSPSEPTLSAWNGSAWRAITGAPLPVEGGIVTTDTTRGLLLLLGAPDAGTATPPPVGVWTFTGGKWRRLDVPLPA
jgi:hypothetical protein